MSKSHGPRETGNSPVTPSPSIELPSRLLSVVIDIDTIISKIKKLRNRWLYKTTNNFWIVDINVFVFN